MTTAAASGNEEAALHWLCFARVVAAVIEAAKPDGIDDDVAKFETARH